MRNGSQQRLAGLIRTPVVGDRVRQKARLSRRAFCAVSGALLAAQATVFRAAARQGPAFSPRYLLASCLYGYAPLREVLPETSKTGAAAIDLWPKVHGNQREQLTELGEESFARMIEEEGVSLGCITQFKLGPYGLTDEMHLAQRLGCPTIVTGSAGPKGLAGAALKAAVGEFCENMKPHLAVAEETGVTIAVENHQNSLIESPDSLRWLAELRPSRHLAIALAPYHLEQNESLLAGLIRALGGSIAVFYAWQHGKGCMQAQPKEDELLQMPGRGPLDFNPLLAALADINYTGWTEIFMHPFPRGRAIGDSTAAVTDEINRARHYLEDKLRHRMDQ